MMLTTLLTTGQHLTTHKFNLVLIALVVLTGQWKTTKATPTYRNDLVTPIYYPKTDDSTVERYGCEQSYDDPDGDCITGRGGIDYPVFSNLPITEFTCKEVQHPGYYADTDAYCQVFHICEANGRQHSVLCPKGTIFNQEVLVCDWWYNVDCSSSVYHYEKNAYIYGSPQYREQSEYGARTQGVPRQYEPYEEDYYYDLVESPNTGNVYNRRMDDTIDETTTTEPTTTMISTSKTTTTTQKPTTTIMASSKPKTSTTPKIKKTTTTDTSVTRFKKSPKVKHQKKPK